MQRIFLFLFKALIVPLASLIGTGLIFGQSTRPQSTPSTHPVKGSRPATPFFRCDCPALVVSTSKQVYAAGEIVTFTVSLVKPDKRQRRFMWTTSAGEIIDGQGTSQIRVRTTRELIGLNVTAATEIDQKMCICENPASETVRVVESIPVQTKSRISEIVTVTLDRSVVDKWCPASKSPKAACPINGERVQIKTDAAGNIGTPLSYRYKVTGGKIVGVGSDVVWDLTDQWLSSGVYQVTVTVKGINGRKGHPVSKSVALRPCPDCDPSCSCPPLAVLASLDSVKPDGIVTFSADVPRSKNDGLTFKWNVANGTIIKGRNTGRISVRTSRHPASPTLIATLEIGGTDPTCNCITSADKSVQIK